MMRNPPIIHARRRIEGSNFLRAEQLDLEFSNGERRTFERLASFHSGAVMIVPMRDADTVLLVREYATGMERYELGLCQGKLDAGETPEEGANREMKEEIGFGARNIIVLGAVSTSPQYMTAMAHIVVATDLYAERLEGDEPEPLEVVPFPMADLHELLAHPEVSSARSIAALFMAREFLAGRFKPMP